MLPTDSECIATLLEEKSTCTDYSDIHKDLVKIGFGSRDMLADRQTDRQTRRHTNTFFA